MQLVFNREEYKSEYIKAGGYVGKVINVVVENNVVNVCFDIETSTYKGMYMKEYLTKGGSKSKFELDKWSKKAIIKFNFEYDGAKKAFARFLDDVETSNQSFKWENDTDVLKGKLVGIVIRKQFYEDKWGEQREGTEFPESTSVKNINNNNFSIEPKKKANVPAPTTTQFDISDDDIEF